MKTALLGLITFAMLLATASVSTREDSTEDQVSTGTDAYLASFIEHPALSECITERYGLQLRKAGLSRFALEPQAPDCEFAACLESRIQGFADYRDAKGALLRTALFMDPPKIPINTAASQAMAPFALIITREHIRVYSIPALPLLVPLSQACDAMDAPLKILSEA